uniref:Cyclin-like domain-containing protein n=1 Tax=Kwoniella dejecticola CBS 10117 TaxID=1296121 RepID=A0A1A5ZUV6_9TREE|nr:uncharacterized protein I303_08364 [Kwoniella dejecticola CBS 10117]OBR81593.1 hypothetical protein I303_08364 [Kwoniella dejecticola CBS 10117]
MRQLRPVEQQWIFSPSALDNTPSPDDGIPLESELKRRKLTIEYMRSLALRANSLVHGDDAECQHLRGTLVVGSVLVHRFYMRKSFKDFEETLIAPTVLFLASKIEEEPLKLRHLVNVSIAKFEKDKNARGWYPDSNPHEQPSREYRSWEKSILATEEILLETLCFDMAVEQPWNALYKSVRGLDEMIARTGVRAVGQNAIGSEGLRGQRENKDDVPPATATATNSSDGTGNGTTLIDEKWKRDTNGHANGVGRLSENSIKEIGWALLSESIIDQVPLSDCLMFASELSERERFDVDVVRTQDGLGVRGADLNMVKSCLADILKYMNEGLIDDGLLTYIVAESELSEERKEPYKYRFTAKPNPALTKEEKHRRPLNGDEGGTSSAPETNFNLNGTGNGDIAASNTNGVGRDSGMDVE